MPSPSKIKLLGICCLAAPLFLFAPSKVQAQLVDLQALGINAGFELPDLGGIDTSEQFSAADFGPGWTFSELAGEISNYGVQDPGVGFFDRVADTGDFDDLAAPFEGRQIGFINLSDPGFSKAEVISNSVGKLQANTNYTLTVGVGTRQNQTAWDVDYEVGLRTLGGTDLGTFSFINRSGADAPTDLTFNLNTGPSHPNIGEEVSIVIRNSNAATASGFSQGGFDNVRLEGSFGPANTPLLTINRNTGSMTLTKTGTDDFSILGYSLTSDAGTLNEANWTRIGGTWSELSNAADDLSEAQLTGGAAETLSSGSPINFGNSWLQTPFEDIEAVLLLDDGSIKPVVVQYSGAPIPFGDLTGDGQITTADWTAFKAGQGSNFAGLLAAEAYVLGDLNNDLRHDLHDFSLFRTAFDDANGVGAFAAMIASVPEPSTVALLGLGLICGGCVRRRSASRSEDHSTTLRSNSWLSMTVPLLFGFVVMTATLLAGNPRVTAQTVGPIPVPNGDFEDWQAIGDGGVTNTGWASVPGGFTPATNVGNNDEMWTNPGSFGSGWQENLKQRTDGKYGLQHPSDAQHSKEGADNRLASLANGHFIGFANLTESDGAGESMSQVQSGILGQIAVGTYTLNVAVGARLNATWEPIDYTISLVAGGLVAGDPNANQFGTSGGTVLGSTTQSNVQFPGSANTEWFDLQLDLDIAAGHANLGDDFAIRIDSVNAGTVTSFTQANFDNVRLVGPTVPQFGLFVDPDTGLIRLNNPTETPVVMSSYRITSQANSLIASGWDPIAGQGVSGFPAGNGTGNGWEAGPQPNNGELVEWNLQGESTLLAGTQIDLGFAYNTSLDARDLSFQYTNASGNVVSGLVFFETLDPGAIPGDFNNDGQVDGDDLVVWEDQFAVSLDGSDFLAWQRNFGAGVSLQAAAVAVPEPSSAMLLVCGALGLALRLSRPGRRGEDMSVGSCRSLSSLVAVLVLIFTSQSVNAAVTVDRLYQFGDDNAEGATASSIVGSGNTFGTTFDSSAVAGFRDLNQVGSPTYVNVGPTGLARPGAITGELGISLNGSSQYLWGLRFGAPATAPGSTGGTPSGAQDYSGITNRGFQLWVRPTAAGLAEGREQVVVHDTNQHGVRIGANGNWFMTYGGSGAGGAQHNSGVAAEADTWSHLMVVRPNGARGGSILYLNGVAIRGQGGGYDLSPEPAGESEFVLTVGANTGNGQSHAIGGPDTTRFSGVVDDLSLFTFGTTLNGSDLGTYNFGEDNQWAQMNLTGVAGDITQNGVLDPVADVNAFIAGFGSENRVNGVLAGDINTLQNGDLNFDGKVDLADAFILHEALVAAGHSGLDFSLLGVAVPEPSSAILVGMLVVGLLVERPLRTTPRDC